MKLIEFTNKYVANNSLVRLWTKDVFGSGHTIVMASLDDVSMEWEIMKREGIFQDFCDREVIGVTDILVEGRYPEAINIIVSG